MVKNCLNCKHEPEWSEFSGGEYRRCYGICRFPFKEPALPPTYRIENKSITRFSDDSGVFNQCKVWKQKSV